LGINSKESGKNLVKNSPTCFFVFSFLKFFQGINRVTVNVLSRLGSAIIMKSPIHIRFSDRQKSETIPLGQICNPFEGMR